MTDFEIARFTLTLLLGENHPDLDDLKTILLLLGNAEVEYRDSSTGTECDRDSLSEAR